MEPKFQTSFIPKKPLPVSGGIPPTSAMMRTPARGTSSLFMVIAVIIFIISLGGIGGVYAWKQYLLRSQEAYKQQLVDRQKQFNLDLIEQLKQVNVQIDTAKQVLANHLAMSQIFSIIGRLTIENVRFLSLDVTAPTFSSPSDGVKISLSGQGTSLSAVAFQSDVLGSLDEYNLRKIVKNPILSDPTLDTSGSVSFGFTATIDPSALSYENSVTGGDVQASSTEQ